MNAQSVAELLRGNPAVVITGERNSGKTALCTETAQLLGADCGGFYAAGVFCLGEKTGYRLVHIPTGESRLLASTTSGDLCDPEKTCYGLSYWFSPRVFAWARECILRDISAGMPVVCVDEAGPVELQNCGFYDILRPRCRTSRTALLLTVRSSLAVRMLRHISLQEAVIVPLKERSNE